jgi:outer membrane protein TolC
MQTVGTSLRLYEAAEDSVLAVLDAQDTLVRQREANVNAKEDYALALVELQRTVGGMLPDADTPCTDQVDSP